MNSNRTSVGAFVGTTVGFLGWLIGLTAVSLRTGEFGVLKQIALPGLAVSLGAALVVVVTLEVAAGAFGRGTLFRRLLWGEILFFVGLLLLLLNHWVAPLVDAAPDLRRAIGVYRTGDLPPAALMAGGAAILGLALARIRRPA